MYSFIQIQTTPPQKITLLFEPSFALSQLYKIVCTPFFIRLCLLFFSLISITVADSALAMGKKNQEYPVGMRTYGVWRSEEKGEERVDIAVWYPAKTRGRPKVLEGWVVPVAGSTRPHPGFFPIILVSHDTASSRFANNDLAIAIAATGNIVISVTHNNDNITSSEALYTAELLVKRPRQLLTALETILDSSDLSSHADESRIGLLGIGFGAITAMQIAGKAPKIEELNGFCSRLSSSDIFCDSWSGRKLRGMAKDLDKLRDMYGEKVLTPPLDLFAPELEKAPIRREPVPLKVEKQKKKGMYAAIKEWLSKKEDDDSEQTDLPPPIEEVPSTSTIVVDFQGGEILGGTLLGYKFVNFPSKDNLSSSLGEEEEEESVTPIAPPASSAPDNRTHHRPSSKRIIRSIALFTPAGGMLFTGYKPLPLPVAIINAEKDELYPYNIHSSPYESLFAETPQVSVVPEADHFSLFAPCSNDLTTMLEDVCGKIKGEDRRKLNKSNDAFLATFFYTTLGGETKEPDPSELVIKPTKKLIDNSRKK